MQGIEIKDYFRENRIVNDRLIFAAVFVLLLFAIIIARLVVLQVFEYEHFNALSDKNRIEIEPLAPLRGLIYDRNGVVLAENIAVFSLELIPEQITDLNGTLRELKSLSLITEEVISAVSKQIKKQRRFREVVLRQQLSEQEVAIFSVNRHRFPGVDVVSRLVRHYPYGHLFAHTVGYVGRINEQEQQRIDQQNYQATQYIGKTGIERFYETILHGQVGYQQVETNVQGRVVRAIKRSPSTAGQDLFLHLDINLQRIASQALQEFNGAIIALEPKTGGILTMLSKPDFDPNPFVTGISSKHYAALRDSPDRPLFDRALRGHYPPGSTLKPFVALAGLELQIVDHHSETFCPGWYSLPGQEHRYRCWQEHGHGKVNFTDAIAQSCDVYFYDLANVLGIDRLHNFLALFGFGQRTAIDLPGESKGLLPSTAWKKTARNQPWYPGETLISGIGQGFNQMTPLQLAQATAILAKRGNNITPQVAKATRNAGQTELQLLPVKRGEIVPIVDAKNWQGIVDSMIEVVYGERGTARQISQGSPVKIAGKTGTAQVFGIKQDEKYDADTLDKKLHDHALFIAFAPADDPEIVIVVVAENGGSGSKTAAPIARKMIDHYFGVITDE